MLKLALSVNWKITILALIFLPILLGLGVWQLNRANEKIALQSHIQSQRAKPELDLAAIEPTENLRWRRVVVEGEFDPQRYFLLDNRVLAGRVGYGAVASLRTQSGWILVDLGWIAGSEYREILPELSLPKGRVMVRGELIRPELNSMVKDEPMSDQWPVRIQRINLPLMGQKLGLDVSTQIMRIDASSPYAMTTDWRDINTSPAKHQGYAVQWFMMALALIIATVYANQKTVRTKE